MFPATENVETPLGPCESVWATSETHIGMRGTFEINRVAYRVRLDLQFRDGEWKRGSKDGDWSSYWHALMVDRADWNGKPASDSARKKAEAALVPWLAAYAVGEGAEMVRKAGTEDKQRKIESARAKIESLRAEIEQAEQDLAALETA